MSLYKYFSVLLFVFFSAIFSFAQVSSQDNHACNPEFARLLVEQQVSESRTVEETDKRVKILLRAADFLWKFDEPTARKYFTEAFQVANERFKEKGFEDKKIGDKERGLTSQMPDYRLEVIRAIAKKDGEWSKRLTEQILAEYEKAAEKRPDSFNQTREISDLLRIAQENVKTNPNLSTYLFRRVMRYPLDHHWYWSLYSVARENPTVANGLYSELLLNYQNETPRRLLFLSAYPFANERIFGVDRYQYGTSVPENFIANPSTQKQFIETFFRRIALFANNTDDINRKPDQYRQPEAVYIVSALQEIEPIIIQKFPALLQRFSEAKAQANSLLNEENRKNLADREKQNENLGLGFEERLKRLKEAEEKGELKDSMIINLATWGKKTEEQFEAVEPWLDKIQDEKVRRESINYYYFLRSKLAIEENRIDDARRYAEKIPEIEHRAILFFDIATKQLKNVYEPAKVFDTLNEVSKLTRQAENSVPKAQVLLGLATMYEKVNHTAALEELGEAIRIVNLLENPDIFSTSVYRQIIGKDYAFFASFSTPGYNMETTFQEISRKDFELSLSHAKSFSDKYFRTLAVLSVAKNCVEMKPKKKPAKK
jgi:hypothetical protein